MWSHIELDELIRYRRWSQHAQIREQQRYVLCSSMRHALRLTAHMHARPPQEPPRLACGINLG